MAACGAAHSTAGQESVLACVAAGTAQRTSLSVRQRKKRSPQSACPSQRLPATRRARLPAAATLLGLQLCARAACEAASLPRRPCRADEAGAPLDAAAWPWGATLRRCLRGAHTAAGAAARTSPRWTSLFPRCGASARRTTLPDKRALFCAARVALHARWRGVAPAQPLLAACETRP